MKINENLKYNDLSGVMLPNVSLDEFEPKTGDKENVAVIGFYVKEQSAGDDLLKYLHRSKFDIRDVEVTPNPDPDNNYMVFVEVDRQEGLLNTIVEISADVKNISGIENWKIKPLLSDDLLDLNSDEVKDYVIETPEAYISKEDFDNKRKQDADNAFEESVHNFFAKSNALNVEILDNKLTIKDYKNSTTLEFVTFGEGRATLEESGLSDLAIDSKFDRELMSQLNSVRGELNIVPINKHIVFHDPSSDKVMVTKPC